jgi:hypothetical protein
MSEWDCPGCGWTNPVTRRVCKCGRDRFTGKTDHMKKKTRPLDDCPKDTVCKECGRVKQCWNHPVITEVPV